MRLTKMLGLAMVAAIAAMAFVGAGTASAVLCKVKESPCSATNQYPAHTTVVFSTEEALLTGSLTVKCKSSATLLHEGIKSGKLFGKVTALTWTSCSGCSPVTTTTLPTFDDEPTGGGDGLATILGTAVTLENCIFPGITCKASAKEADLTLHGGTVNGTANATANNVPIALSGGLCGTTGTWNAGGAGGGKPYVVLSVNGVKTGSIFME